MVLVKLFGTLRRPGMPGSFSVEVGATVLDALEGVFALVPGLREQVLRPGRAELLPHVNVMLKGRLVRDLQGLATPVADGDTLAIFPPSAGG